MNIERTLKIASHLARCSNAIQKLKSNQALEDEEQSWVYNLFNMGWDDPYKEDKGKISFMIFADDKEKAEALISLSNNISSNSVTTENLEFILNGLLEYRKYLLMKSHPYHCDCDI